MYYITSIISTFLSIHLQYSYVEYVVKCKNIGFIVTLITVKVVTIATLLGDCFKYARYTSTAW